MRKATLIPAPPARRNLRMMLWVTAGAGLAWWLLAPSAAPEPAAQPGRAQTVTSAGTPREPSVLPADHPWAPTRPGDGTAESAATADLQNQVAQLSEDLALLRQQIGDLSHRVDSTVPAEPPRKPTDAAARAEAQQADQRVVAARDTAFRAEPADAQWAGGAAAALRQALGSANGPAPVILALECRSRTCRAEVTPPDDSDPDEWLAATAARMSGGLGALAADPSDRNDAKGARVIYFSR